MELHIANLLFPSPQPNAGDELWKGWDDIIKNGVKGTTGTWIQKGILAILFESSVGFQEEGTLGVHMPSESFQEKASWIWFI